MDQHDVLPDAAITTAGDVSRRFLELGIASFREACRYVHALPYGYNSDRDDLMILFKERFGSCATKHAVIATLAEELELKVQKRIGIYAMTEEIVEGADQIADKYELPYVPMLHCFLEYGNHWIDLTEGNSNGKKRSIEAFLFTQKVIPNISAKDEYLQYRKALKEEILAQDEFKGIELKRVLHAREEGIALLEKRIEDP
jgi:hypothetical protein